MKWPIKWPFMISTLFVILSVLVALFLYQNTTLLPEQDIVIGVLSAQNNFEARRSIRDTWKKHVNSQSVSLYFIIGEKFCSIPLPDRISPYSCEEKSVMNVGLPIQTEGISTFKKCSHRLKPMYAGFTFIVHNSLVVKRLNILKSIVDTFHSVKVYLIDSSTQETIVSAYFTRTNDSYKSTVLSKAVEAYILPKDFEGQIVMEPLSLPLMYNCSLEWNNASNALSYIQLIPSKQQKPIAFHTHSFSPVSMVFDVHDLEEAESHVKNRANRQVEWDKRTQSLRQQLMKEATEMKDILLLNVIDVYRSLAKKLLLFLHWVYTNKKFSFLVKTDDDTFLNVMEIERELSSIKQRQDQTLWWWGSYRDQWAVASSGKWRDDVYRSLTYPSFPCGSGYVLSYAVVGYLVRNAALLQTGFQGEDVSVGIWLAGLDTIQHRSEELTWACNHTCLDNACNRAQLTAEQMYETWDFYNKCGSLCNCTSLH